MLEYKGYVGTVEFEPDDMAFHGEVVGLAQDGIHFTGKTAEEIEQAFRESVDDYLAWCAERGVEPDRPYSGKIMIRIDPAHHRKAAISAKAANLSINKWFEQLIEIA